MTMRCDHARTMVSDYINGDLDAPTAALLEEHLRDCPNCPPIYAALVAVRARLGALAREVPARDQALAERVRRVLDR